MSRFPYLDAFCYQRSVFRDARTPVDFIIDKTDYGSVSDIAIGIPTPPGKVTPGAGPFSVLHCSLCPREVWREKPPNMSFRVAVDTNFPNRNLDSPLWAEGYMALLTCGGGRGVSDSR